MSPANAKSVRALGILFLIIAPALSFGAWHAANGPLETLAWFEKNRSPRDSAGYGSALYHAGHAQAAHDNRWHLTGYATLGLIGTLAGAALVVSSWTRRR